MFEMTRPIVLVATAMAGVALGSTVTTESVNGKKNTLRRSVRRRPRFRARARARGTARIGSVLATV